MSTFSAKRPRTHWLLSGGITVTLLCILSTLAIAEEAAKKSRADLHEPVFRVTKQDRPIKTAATAIVSSSNQQSAKEAVSTSEAAQPAVPASTPATAPGVNGVTPTAPSNVVPLTPSPSNSPQPSAELVETKPEHPLEAPLRIAAKALELSRQKVNDYTAVLVKRERVSGRLNDPQYMFIKVRNEKTNPAGKIVTPFSFYIKFLKPSSVKGREVIFVKGQNNNKLVAP